MARRVRIRSREFGTEVAILEEMLAEDVKAIQKEHLEDLQNIAVRIEDDAKALAPSLTGKLEDSISVVVSKSYRYPGFMVSAHAMNGHGFDYAVIQEQNEEYDHDYTLDIDEGKPRSKDFAIAHFLSGPFAKYTSDYFKKLTGKSLDLPPELQHALDYYKSHRYG